MHGPSDSLHYLAQQLNIKTSQLAQTVGDIERRAATKLACHDGWPSSSWGDGTPRGSSTLTSVESAAGSRLAVTAGHSLKDYPDAEAWGGIDQLHDDLIAANQMLDSMLIIRNRILNATRQVEPPRPQATAQDRCCGGHVRRWEKHGGAHWGDPLCSELVHAFGTTDEGGLCAKHIIAARQWCRANDVEWNEPTLTQRAV